MTKGYNQIIMADTQPLLNTDEEENSSSTLSSVVRNGSLETVNMSADEYARSVGNSPPPPYAISDAPPPYAPSGNMLPTQPPPLGVMGEPTVVCRVCQQLVFIRGREGQRVVKCSNCHEATPIKAPPAGKKYIRCPCNALLTCRATSTRISCPRANCKRVINVGGGPPSAAPVTNVQPNADARIRVTCGHCNETFVFRTTAHLARCPYCRKVSSVGPKFAKHRAIIFAVIGILFLAVGAGVTIGTFQKAKNSGGLYVVWTGAFLVGFLNLIRSCYYCAMTVSQIESQP